jgi:hypothetical protein
MYENPARSASKGGCHATAGCDANSGLLDLGLEATKGAVERLAQGQHGLDAAAGLGPGLSLTMPDPRTWS